MTRIRIYESEGSPYCIREEVTVDGIDVLDDSQKIWWPFDCDDLTLDETAELCRKHFPDDEVVIDE